MNKFHLLGINWINNSRIRQIFMFLLTNNSQTSTERKQLRHREILLFSLWIRIALPDKECSVFLPLCFLK